MDENEIASIIVNTAFEMHKKLGPGLFESVHGILHDLTYDELISEISKLPPGYRTVFNMHVIDGKGHKEIASELEITESTSKTQLFKARNLLKKNLMAKTLIRTK